MPFGRFEDTFNNVLNAYADRDQKALENKLTARKNAIAEQQYKAQQQAGGLAAGGDTAGATNALFRAGDLKGGQDFQTGQQSYQETGRKQHAEQVQRIARGLRGALQSGQHTPQQALAMARQFAPSIGVDPAEIDTIAPHFESDPKATLDFLDQQVAKELEFAKSSDGSYTAADKATGRPVYQYQAPRPDKYEQFDPEKEIRRIPGTPGGAVDQASPASAAGGDWLSGVSQAAPDARVTSGYRTPEHNKAVGGVPNSRHLSGQAVDLVPRPGETMAQLYARVRSVPGVKAIPEGDHVHVQATGAPDQAAGGPELVRAAQPKVQEITRPATAAEKAAYGIPANVPAKIKANGDIDVISGTGANMKPVPPRVQQGYVENNANITQIDQAIEALRANPHAMGMMNMLGDEIRQRADPGGINVRARVANVGAVKIHDLSGAAVTAAETPRLKPFIPMPTDTAVAAIAKLEQLKGQIQNNNAQIEVQYGEDSGYRPMGGQGRETAAQAPARQPPAQTAHAPPKNRVAGQTYPTPRGPMKWTGTGWVHP